MTENSEGTVGAGPSHQGVEIGVAIATAIFALIVIGGSIQAGIDWGVEGPRSGFLPFYVGLIILGASVVTLVQIFAGGVRSGPFANWEQLRRVMSVVVPSTIYVFAIPYLGIYVASALLVGVFMKWLGRYGWGLVLAISIGVPIVTFIVFEMWFLVPLPKGPVEEFLGL